MSSCQPQNPHKSLWCHPHPVVSLLQPGLVVSPPLCVVFVLWLDLPAPVCPGVPMWYVLRTPCTQQAPPNPVSGQPTWWGLASSCPSRREQKKPDYQVSFPLPPGGLHSPRHVVQGTLGHVWRHFWLSHLRVEGGTPGTSGQSSGILPNILQ